MDRYHLLGRGRRKLLKLRLVGDRSPPPVGSATWAKPLSVLNTVSHPLFCASVTACARFDPAATLAIAPSGHALLLDGGDVLLASANVL
jgi:hypothetical protein